MSVSIRLFYSVGESTNYQYCLGRVVDAHTFSHMSKPQSIIMSCVMQDLVDTDHDGTDETVVVDRERGETGSLADRKRGSRTC